MKYFITGGSGLIGRHLVPLLQGRGHEVLSFDVSPGWNFMGGLGDVMELTLLLEELRDFEPDKVIHLAAQSGVKAARDDPHHAITLNVMGTVNVLEACRQLGIKDVVTASSNHVYGEQVTNEYVWEVNEDSPLNHRDLYSATKVAGDVLTQSYAECYGMNAVAVRNTNTFGPADPHADHIVPATIHALLNDGLMTLREGRAAKSYLYVEDCADAYAFIADNAVRFKGQGVNVVGSDPVRPDLLVGSLYRIAGKSVPEEAWIIGPNPNMETAEDMSAQKLSNAGWMPKYPLEMGLRLTWEWFKEEHEKRERADAEAQPVRG